MAKNLKNLRSGFSTGTAATAAALAAARYLMEGKPPDLVEVLLPDESLYQVKLEEATKIDPASLRTMVIKDAGDDPDVTNGAGIGVILNPTKTPGLKIIGGLGVGKLTKPGLVLPPGEWAINPVPRSMLHKNLAPFLTQESGLSITVFINQGEELAKRTLNPRLGIIGGLSVLGTTGLVKPFSNEAYLATIDSSMSMAKAIGLKEVVLTTGGQSENFAREHRPYLPEEAFIQMADFFRDALELATKYGFETIGLAVFFGKAVKQAAGIAYTHAHQSELDVKNLLEWLPDLSFSIQQELSLAPTARAALEVLKKYRVEDKIPYLATQMLKATRNFTGPGPNLWATIFDYDGRILADEKY